MINLSHYRALIKRRYFVYLARMFAPIESTLGPLWCSTLSVLSIILTWHWRCGGPWGLQSCCRELAALRSSEQYDTCSGQDGCHMACPGHMCCTSSAGGQLCSAASLRGNGAGKVVWTCAPADGKKGQTWRESEYESVWKPRSFTSPSWLSRSLPTLPTRDLKRAHFATCLLPLWSETLSPLHRQLQNGHCFSSRTS